MPNDPDIYRDAKLLIDQHGADAGLRAAERADQLLDAGDMIGAATWRQRAKKPVSRKMRIGCPFAIHASALRYLLLFICPGASRVSRSWIRRSSGLKRMPGFGCFTVSRHFPRCSWHSC